MFQYGSLDVEKTHQTWRAAQSHARPHLADGLLERNITGTVEHYYRRVLVGEPPPL